MKILPLCFIALSFSTFAQSGVDSIKQQYVQNTLNHLAADSLKGRGNFTPQLYKSSHFIAKEFDGLKSFPGFDGFFQPFQMEGSKAKGKDSAGNYLFEKVLLNVIGVLPGKTKPDEVIIFSAHYDHVGIEAGEIHNGAMITHRARRPCLHWQLILRHETIMNEPLFFALFPAKNWACGVLLFLHLT